MNSKFHLHSLFTLSTICFTMGLVDIFLDSDEVNKIFGLPPPADLYYVRNGSVNSYALQFRVVVGESIDTIVFTWRSHSRIPIRYAIGVTLSRPDVLETPYINVDKRGVIPKKTERIIIPVRCTGKIHAEVMIDVQFNYTYPTELNYSSIIVFRKKTCSLWQNDVPFDDTLMDNSRKSSEVERAKNLRIGDDSFIVSPSNIFYVTVGCVCGFIVVIAAMVSLYFLRVKRLPTVKLPETTINGQRYMVAATSGANSLQSQPFIRSHSPSNNSKYSSIVSTSVVKSRYSPSVSIIAAGRRDIDIAAVLADIQIDRNTIVIDHLILEGTYGEFALAKVRTQTPETENSCETADSFAIMVKTTKESATESQNFRFLSEALMFYGIPPHSNIMQVIGASVAIDSDSGLSYGGNSPPPLLCYPYPIHGNLKKFLLRCRGAEIGSSHALSTQNLVFLAVQIAQGMTYLHQNRLVHQDLATRNCWLDDNLRLMIGDIALSRDVFPGDYFCLGDNENRPVKWLALEALQNHQFSSASDVWAFGVTLWELMTLAQQPYGDVDPFEMADHLKNGYRLQQPYNCPDELFGIMFCCCALNPGSRPTFYQLFVALQDFCNQLQSFV